MKLKHLLFLCSLSTYFVYGQNCSTYSLTVSANSSILNCGEQTQLAGSVNLSTGQTVSYIWSDNPTFASPISTNASVFVSPRSTSTQATFTYYCRATRSDGCVATKSLPITVNSNIVITQTVPASSTPFIVTDGRSSIRASGLNTPSWSEWNEQSNSLTDYAEISLRNTTTNTVTVVGSSAAYMPGAAIRVLGTNTVAGCPTERVVRVYGLNASVSHNGIAKQNNGVTKITNCNGANPLVLTGHGRLTYNGTEMVFVPSNGNVAFNWYVLPNSSPPQLYGTGTSVSIPKPNNGTYYLALQPSNIGNAYSGLLSVEFSDNPNPTQGISLATAIPLNVSGCGTPVTVNTLCYPNNYYPPNNRMPGLSASFITEQHSNEIVFKYTSPSCAQLYGPNMCPNNTFSGISALDQNLRFCADFDVHFKVVHIGDPSGEAGFDYITESNSDFPLCATRFYHAPMYTGVTGKSYYLIVEGKGNANGNITVQYGISRGAGDGRCDVNARKAEEIDDLDNPSTFNIYPSPASDALTVETDNPGEIKLYSIDNALLESVPSTGMHTTLDISKYNTGMYIAEIKNEKGTKRKKFTIQK